jgi:hypothetical protein
MLLGNETVTLLRRGSGGWSCTVMEGASWLGYTGVRPEGAGERPESAVRVRIPRSACYVMPRPGDYLAHGTCRSVTDLAQLQGIGYIRIASVRDNGLEGMRLPPGLVTGG